jgi:hypothetical protein
MESLGLLMIGTSGSGQAGGVNSKRFKSRYPFTESMQKA